jgi:pyrophosphatase PpaX
MTTRSDHGPLRAVLFDLDGTLLDSERVDLLSMTRLFRDDLGLDVDEEDVSKYRSIPSREVLGQVAPDRVEELLVTWQRYQEDLLDEAELFPGVLESMQALSKADLGLGVVTGQSKAELNATRRHIAMDGLIDVWVSSDDAPFSKPHPAPLFVALETLGCPAGQAVMIGDTGFDMEAGRRAGTLLGAALWGVRDPALLLAYEPDHVFEHPQQMTSLCLTQRL